MSGRGAVAASVLAALLLLGGTSARAATWSAVFAAEEDTTYFLQDDGALVRAPFHLRDRLVLWEPRDDEHVRRILAAPVGGRMAWLTRAGNRAPTTLWVDGPEGARPVARFQSPVPSDYGLLRYESDVPTADDPGTEGGRLLTSGALVRGICAHPFAWTLDAGALLFGSTDGVARTRSVGGGGEFLSRALLVSLQRLAPSPIYLAEYVHVGQGNAVDIAPPPTTWTRGQGGTQAPSQQTREGRRVPEPTIRLQSLPEIGACVLYVAGNGIRTFPGQALQASEQRAASFDAVWWAQGRTIQEIRAHDPVPRVVAELRSPPVWLEYDPGRDALLWLEGARLIARPANGGADSLLLELGQPARRALDHDGGNWRGFVTADSVVLWDRATGRRRAAALGSARPTRFFAGPQDAIVIAGGGGWNAALSLHRLDGSGSALRPLAAPRGRSARVIPTPSGSKLIVYRSGTRATDRLDVYDFEADVWHEVERPAITAWESARH